VPARVTWRCTRAVSSASLWWGGIGVGVNSALLYLLSEAGGLNHLLAAALATEATILCNFALNDCWTFHDARSTVSWRRRAVRYNSIALGGLGISLAVLALAMRELRLYYLIANMFAIGAATLWNYIVNARFTWTTFGHGSHHW
jgi:putative flippase GtrA